ncbi:MAG: hypothetical protein H5T50_08680 [Nitrososphaeria archaeon]|nr:hypothetical protein [Nitrososphaeria archaeon]
MSISEEIEACFKEFEEELEFARNLLLVLKMRSLRTEIRSVRPLAALRDEFGPIRSYAKEFIDQVSEAALPLILIYCVSSLEVFLRSLWELKMGDITRDLRRIFSDLKCFSKKIKHKYNVEIGRLVFQANAVAQKRHILIHNKGVIDNDSLSKFREAGITEFSEGQKLLLTVEDVEKDIKVLEEFATTVKDFFLKC